jgi:hypothetical protein
MPAEDEFVRPHVEPGGPLDRIFGSEGDPKGWGRATLKLLTHPLHRFPDVKQSDLMLPKRQDPLRLAGDCVVIGAVFAVLAYFPLLLVSLAITADLGNWILGTMSVAGFSAAAYVFCRARSPDTRELDRF